MNLARANVLDYDIPLRMLTNIATRDENISFITNYAALNKVQYLYEMLVLSSVYKKFEVSIKKYIASHMDHSILNQSIFCECQSGRYEQLKKFYYYRIISSEFIIVYLKPSILMKILRMDI